MSAALLPTLWNSVRVTLRAWWRVLRQLMHEAAGTLFALFAAYGVLAAWRQWKNRPVKWIMAAAIVYAAMMIAFSIASFRAARRVR
jgi:predicted negative regulator of RcsB-dependent stress response